MKFSKNNKTRDDTSVKSGINIDTVKRKRKWVRLAISGVVLFSTGLAVTSETVMASANSAIVTIRKSSGGTDFKQKDDFLSQKEVKTESEAAYGRITAKWTDNTVEDVETEIKRQKEIGLPIYVIQWGDTLSVLAKVLDVSIESLAKANALENDDLILTGDVLQGVFSKDVVSTVSPTKLDTKEEINMTIVQDEVVEKEVAENRKITPVDVDKDPDPNPDLKELPEGMIVEDEKNAKDNTSGDNKELDKPVVLDDRPTIIPFEPIDNSIGNDVDKDIIVEQDETSITYEAVTTIKKGTVYVADDTLATDEMSVVSEGKDGSVKQTRKYGAYSDGVINHDNLGEEKRIEAEPEVIHYGPTINLPVDKAAVEVITRRNLKEISVIGAINSNVFSYFIQSDLSERLIAEGYQLELTGDVIVVLGNPEDINADVSEDLQLLFAYNSADQPLKYKKIDSTNKSDAAVVVLEAVAKLNAIFKTSQLKNISVEAKGIESNSIIMTLIDWSLTNSDKTNINDINTDYQTFMKNIESAVAQHMADLEK